MAFQNSSLANRLHMNGEFLAEFQKFLTLIDKVFVRNLFSVTKSLSRLILFPLIESVLPGTRTCSKFYFVYATIPHL